MKLGFIAAITLGAMPLLPSSASAAPQSAVSWPQTPVSVAVEIVGEVAKPGNYEFQVSDKPTLLALVLASGGLTRNPARVHVKVRRGARSFSIDIENLMKLKIDFALQEGDLVTITAHRVFIGGAVKNSGDYSLPDSGTLSVADALLLAGGAIEAEGNHVTLFLAAKNAKPRDHIFDILPGDFNRLLQDGDSLFVSNPKVKVWPLPPVTPGIPRPYVAPKPKSMGRLYLLGSSAS